jgi:hypothetical protein
MPRINFRGRRALNGKYKMKTTKTNGAAKKTPLHIINPQAKRYILQKAANTGKTLKQVVEELIESAATPAKTRTIKLALSPATLDLLGEMSKVKGRSPDQIMEEAIIRHAPTLRPQTRRDVTVCFMAMRVLADANGEFPITVTLKLGASEMLGLARMAGDTGETMETTFANVFESKDDMVRESLSDHQSIPPESKP